MVARPRHRQGRRRLRSADGIQHRRDRGADPAARRPAAALHRSGVCGDERRGQGAGAQSGRQRRQCREGRQGAALAQSAQHAGLQHGEVHPRGAGGDEPDRAGVQPDPAGRHPDHIQDGVDRRTRLRRQRAARDLPDRSRKRPGAHHRHRQDGRAELMA